MSSKPRERAPGSFGLRLNLWYAAIFILTASGLFWLAYFILSNTLQQNDREVLRARLEEYRAWYEVGKINWLSYKFYNTPNSGKNAFLVRVTSRLGGEALFISVPEDWQGFDPATIQAVGVDEAPPYSLLSGKNPRQVWLIASARLSDGRLLQVGKSTAQTAALLDHFRVVFSLILIAVVVLGLAAGAFFTSRALRPIRQLGDTVRDILTTGKMDARVPARGNRDEIDELVSLFNRMLEKNEALIQGMRDALDNVAHDLRTPMARLRGVAEQALQSNDPQEAREALADAIEESERLMIMLKTLMDISEAETGTMKLDLEDIRLSELVEHVVELYRIVADEKQIHLVTSVPADLVVRADRIRFQQCLANLVDNALKYTRPNGRVEILAHREPSRVVMAVKDNGIGIPETDIPRIWDRLYRGDKSRHEKGLGLGLSLVKAVVEAHRGQVRVESRPEQGSEFTIALPA